MARIKRSVATRKLRKDYLKAAKGFTGGRRRLWRTVRNAVDRARQYAYRDRRKRKQQFRRLWIARINAAARINGTTYSQLMGALRKADVALNRKALADLAMHEPDAFTCVVKQAKNA